MSSRPSGAHARVCGCRRLARSCRPRMQSDARASCCSRCRPWRRCSGSRQTCWSSHLNLMHLQCRRAHGRVPCPGLPWRAHQAGRPCHHAGAHTAAHAQAGGEREVCRPAWRKPDAVASSQAVGHATEVLVTVRFTEGVPPAAKGLLASLVKLLASARAPGAGLRGGLQVSCARRRRVAAPAGRRVRAWQAVSGEYCARARDVQRGGRQDALIFYTTDMLHADTTLRAGVCGLPVELLPHALGQLLPLLLLPPERVRALSAPWAPQYRPTVLTDWVSIYLSTVMVRPRLPASGRSCDRAPMHCRTGMGLARGGRCARAGQMRPARLGHSPRGVQGAGAGAPGRGALFRRGAVQDGRVRAVLCMCAPPATLVRVGCAGDQGLGFKRVLCG